MQYIVYFYDEMHNATWTHATHPVQSGYYLCIQMNPTIRIKNKNCDAYTLCICANASTDFFRLFLMNRIFIKLEKSEEINYWFVLFCSMSAICIV